MNKTTKIYIISGAVVITVAAIFFTNSLWAKSDRVSLSITEAQKGAISKKINLTGQVKASQGVDMAFESSGKIVANYVKVGDKIHAGQPLVSIDSSILQSQLKQAQAQLLQAQAAAKGIDINVAQSKADSNLQAAYVAALGCAQKSVTVAKNTLMIMTDIQYNHFIKKLAAEDINIEDLKARAAKSLLGADGAGYWTSQSLSLLKGGAFGQVQAAMDNPTQQDIDKALALTLESLDDIRKLIDSIPMDTSISPSEKTSIVAEKSYISAEIISISNAIQNISSQKVNNDATMITTNSQIESANANVKVIEANIETIKVQISKTTLRALFDGQVDKNDAVVGALIGPATPVVTISNNNLEIQVNIPESEVANVKVGNNANVTLDALGTSEIFEASVISIDSAQSTDNGIAVYKARLKFNDIDGRIKSGMTANVTIIPQIREGALIVPSSAIIQKNGKYFVIVDKGEGQKENREVIVGLKDGKNTEIISGLDLGEKVYSY